MSQSFADVCIHLVFSTKNRRRYFQRPEIRDGIWCSRPEDLPKKRPGSRGGGPRRHATSYRLMIPLPYPRAFRRFDAIREDVTLDPVIFPAFEFK